MPYNPNIHHRRSIRLQGYDYSRAGAYFVTICCNNRSCRFGAIVDNNMILNDYGIIAYNEWIKLSERFSNFDLDVFQIMPNHIHGIIVLNAGATLAVAPDYHAVRDGAVPPDNHAVRATLAVAPDNHAVRDGAVAPDNHAVRDNAVAPDHHAVRDNAVPRDNYAVGATLAVAPDNRAVRDSAVPPDHHAVRDSAVPPDHHAVRDSAAPPDHHAVRDNAVPPNDRVEQGNRVDDVERGAGASPAPTVSDIVGAYKSLVANGCLGIYKSKNATMGKLWQRNYYEHIIRDEPSYQNISNYIINNPANWNDDKFYLQGGLTSDQFNQE